MAQERQLETARVIRFVNERNVRLHFSNIGGKGGPNLTMSVDGSHIPFPGGGPGSAAIGCIMRLMESKGVQWHYDERPGT